MQLTRSCDSPRFRPDPAVGSARPRMPAQPWNRVCSRPLVCDTQSKEWTRMTNSMTSPTAARQRVTVIIPAHDEAQAIRPTLTHLLSQDFDGQLRIVVVPNGCKDNTAEIARSFKAQFRQQG